MSVRSLNWLKFGGLVGMAFFLGLLFAGLLDLPRTSLAQGAGLSRLTGGQSVIPTIQAPPLPAARPLAELSDAFAAVAEHVRPSVVYVKSTRKQQAARNLRIPEGFEPFFQQPRNRAPRSEEHTSELQSRLHLVCRLLLEKKNQHPAARLQCV